jgi:hypothetical protein
VLVQNAFYSGAQSMFKVLGYLFERGDYELLHKEIERLE